MSGLQLKLCSSSLVIIITGFFTRKLNLCIGCLKKFHLHPSQGFSISQQHFKPMLVVVVKS